MACLNEAMKNGFIPCGEGLTEANLALRLHLKELAKEANDYVTNKAIEYIKACGYTDITREFLDSEGIYLASFEQSISQTTNYQVYKKDVPISPPFGYLIKDFQITFF